MSYFRSVDEELSEIAQKLWDLDEERAKWDDDLTVDLQRSVLGNSQLDRCNGPLFNYVNEDKLTLNSTYSAFISLLDNYISQTGEREVKTRKEKLEECHFLEACLNTAVMKCAFEYLVEKNVIPDNIKEFKRKLNKIWFEFYNRSTRDRDEDSCAFEHVFIGEENNKGAIGCHNWINFYLKEKHGVMNYFGYMPKQCQVCYIFKQENILIPLLKSCDESGNPDVITLQYSQNGYVKSIGGFLMGVSPEFEIALYTIIFLCSEKTVTKLQFANMNINFKCFKMNRDGENVLATIYPSTK